MSGIEITEEKIKAILGDHQGTVELFQVWRTILLNYLMNYKVESPAKIKQIEALLWNDFIKVNEKKRFPGSSGMEKKKQEFVRAALQHLTNMWQRGFFNFMGSVSPADLPPLSQDEEIHPLNPNLMFKIDSSNSTMVGETYKSRSDNFPPTKPVESKQWFSTPATTSPPTTPLNPMKREVQDLTKPSFDWKVSSSSTIDWNSVRRIVSQAVNTLDGHHEFFDLRHKVNADFDKKVIEVEALKQLQTHLAESVPIVEERQKKLRSELFQTCLQIEEEDSGNFLKPI